MVHSQLHRLGAEGERKGGGRELGVGVGPHRGDARDNRERGGAEMGTLIGPDC